MHNQMPDKLIYPSSLGDSVDALNGAEFFGWDVSEQERCQAAQWIADRQGLPGAYAGMFAPTEHDYAFGALTFTGEPVLSGAGTGHVLSEEACRALFRLGAKSAEIRGDPAVQKALEHARRGIFRRLSESQPNGAEAGVYCCGQCSVALWRHLSASGESADERRLAHGLSELRRHRDGKGRWRRFPFFYTLLALSEIRLPKVRDELYYAAETMERSLRRFIKTDPDMMKPHELRRRRVLERIFEQW